MPCSICRQVGHNKATCANKLKITASNKVNITMELLEKEVANIEITDEDEKYSLIENTKENTQIRILAEIFEDYIGKEISKREVEKIYGFKISCKNVNFNTINSIHELIDESENLPGDLQRDIRIFYDKFKKYGLKKIGKGKTLKYIWNPVNKYEDFVKRCPRNLFKKDKERFAFCKLKNNECELCNVSGERMAIDHWRAHSVYGIDNIEIAVLLCEKCNNIHHDYDAIKVAKNYNTNTKIIKNWIKIESRMQKLGHMPNEDDKKEQLKTIKFITDEFTEDSISLKDGFWKGLDK